jgi:hypothetical protein
VGWIQLDQERVQWLAVANTVINDDISGAHCGEFEDSAHAYLSRPNVIFWIRIYLYVHTIRMR